VCGARPCSYTELPGDNAGHAVSSHPYCHLRSDGAVGAVSPTPISIVEVGPRRSHFGKWQRQPLLPCKAALAQCKNNPLRPRAGLQIFWATLQQHAALGQHHLVRAHGTDHAIIVSQIAFLLHPWVISIECVQLCHHPVSNDSTPTLLRTGRILGRAAPQRDGRRIAYCLSKQSTPLSRSMCGQQPHSAPKTRSDPRRSNLLSICTACARSGIRCNQQEFVRCTGTGRIDTPREQINLR
jgi:hypothetical protein